MSLSRIYTYSYIYNGESTTNIFIENKLHYELFTDLTVTHLPQNWTVIDSSIHEPSASDSAIALSYAVINTGEFVFKIQVDTTVRYPGLNLLLYNVVNNTGFDSTKIQVENYIAYVASSPKQINLVIDYVETQDDNVIIFSSNVTDGYPFGFIGKVSYADTQDVSSPTALIVGASALKTSDVTSGIRGNPDFLKLESLFNAHNNSGFLLDSSTSSPHLYTPLSHIIRNNGAKLFTKHYIYRDTDWCYMGCLKNLINSTAVGSMLKFAIGNDNYVALSIPRKYTSTYTMYYNGLAIKYN